MRGRARRHAPRRARRLQLSHCHAYASDGASQRWRFLGGRFHRGVEHEQRPVHRLPGRRILPVTGCPAGVRNDAYQVPAWQLVRQSRDGTDPLFRLETSGPGGPALCLAAGNLGDNDQTPLVAASCQGFGNAAEILELG